MIKHIQLSFKIPSLDKSIFGVQTNLTNKVKAFKYPAYSRVNIEVDNGTNSDQIEVRGINDKICNIYVKADVDALQKSTYLELIKASYRIAQVALTELWREKQWDINDIEALFLEVQKEDYKCELPYFKKSKSKDLKIAASVSMEVVKDCANFILNVYEGGDTKRLQLISTMTNQFLFDRFFNSFYWDQENRYVLCDREKEMFLVCDIYNLTVDIKFESKSNNESELKHFYDLLLYEEGGNNESKLYQLPLM